VQGSCDLKVRLTPRAAREKLVRVDGLQASDAHARLDPAA
jgi:hypothetical protein